MQTKSIDAYPLCWPQGWDKTKSYQREKSKFKSTFAVARDELFNEVSRLRGRYFYGNDPVLSTNVSLRQDGLPYANQRNPEDPGVAIYFDYKDKPMCFACDKYLNVWENMVSIRKTIEAIRGIERWGASDMMSRAFSGFVAIEEQLSWRDVLQYFGSCKEELKHKYRQALSVSHPDKGGSNEEFFAVKKAYDEAIAELN